MVPRFIKGILMMNTRNAMKKRRRAFVLVEVLLSMTILAICGGTLMRSIMYSMEVTRVSRDITKAIYLTKIKLHEFEMDYANKFNDYLGEFRGRYEQPGAAQFRWVAFVDYSTTHAAYIITVQTLWGEEKYRKRYRRFRDTNAGFTLKTMVPQARYNEDLQFGQPPTKRLRSGGGSRRGGGSGRVGNRSIGGGR
jgi:uncharacterized membrane protein YgcG